MNIFKILTKKPSAEKTVEAMTVIRDAKLRELMETTRLSESEKILYKLAFTQGAHEMMNHMQEVGYL